MIIQLRGTSGSGKSTAMTRIMNMMGDWNSAYVPGRKKPLYYYSCSDWPTTYILGHYESPCGGCDTIGAAPKVFELIERLGGGESGHILCEGLLLSEDVKWSSQLKGLRVYYLTTEEQDCLDNIKKRRESVGNLKTVDPSNTINRVGVIERSRIKLKALGVSCLRCSSDQAVKLVTDKLRGETQWIKNKAGSQPKRLEMTTTQQQPIIITSWEKNPEKS